MGFVIAVITIEKYFLHTFRHTTFRALFLIMTLMVVLLCALKTNVAYHSKIPTPSPTATSHLSYAALFDSESINTIVHGSANAEEPCFVTKKLLTQSLSGIEDLTPLLFLIAIISLLSTQRAQQKPSKRVDSTPPKNRLHLTLCTFRE